MQFQHLAPTTSCGHEVGKHVSLHVYGSEETNGEQAQQSQASLAEQTKGAGSTQRRKVTQQMVSVSKMGI